MMGHIVKIRFAILLLSIGIAATYFYAGISALQHPGDWIAFLPQFLRDNPLGTSLLAVFSVFELMLAVWLVSGLRTTFAAIISAALMTGIILVNPTALLITFRDVAIVFSSLALAVLARR